MFIYSDGIRLSCKLDQAAPDSPLVIILHGITGNQEERHIVGVADAFVEAGFGALRLDLYGHGESEGLFSEHTLSKWINNTLDAIMFAKTVSRRIFLCGHSQGGLTAVLAGAISQKDLSGLVLLSPACSIPDGARKGELLGMRFDPEHIPDQLELPGKGQSVGSVYIREAQRIRTDEAFFPGPVLIVHGEADQTIPVSWSKDLVRQYPNGKLVIIPDDTHCYDYHLDAVMDAVKTWAKDVAGGTASRHSE